MRDPWEQVVATMELTGGKAVIAIVIGGIVLAVNYFAASADLDKSGVALIQQEIYFEYLRDAQARDKKAGNHKLARKLKRQSDIRIASLTARGARDSTIVRVEIEPHAAQPTNVERVRYFELAHSHLTGWTLKRESSNFSYHTKLF